MLGVGDFMIWFVILSNIFLLSEQGEFTKYVTLCFVY